MLHIISLFDYIMYLYICQNDSLVLKTITEQTFDDMQNENVQAKTREHTECRLQLAGLRGFGVCGVHTCIPFTHMLYI